MVGRPTKSNLEKFFLILFLFRFPLILYVGAKQPEFSSKKVLNFKLQGKAQIRINIY